MSVIEELAVRCEAATGADVYLNEDILRALGWTEIANVPFTPDGHRAREIPNYTASLDDAMTLAPSTSLVLIRELWNEDCTTKSGFASIHHYANGMYVAESNGCAATPALSLCAAALRAKGDL